MPLPKTNGNGTVYSIFRQNSLFVENLINALQRCVARESNGANLDRRYAVAEAVAAKMEAH